MKLVDKVTVLPVVTTHEIPVERVLSAALSADLRVALVIGQDKEWRLYFASSDADGGTALWWMEKAKSALMEISA